MERRERLSCPCCPSNLRPVAARARSGYLIELDQCPTCGGIWCDQWELFPIQPEEALRLDPLDEGRLHTRTAPGLEPGRCPRCTIPLSRFRDPALPPDARIERCRVCQGMWLNRGELARWKGQHGGARQPLADASPERVAAAYGLEANWPTVENLDAAFDAPRDPDFDGAEARAAVGSVAAWAVLRFLLRLLLRS